MGNYSINVLKLLKRQLELHFLSNIKDDERQASDMKYLDEATDFVKVEFEDAMFAVRLYQAQKNSRELNNLKKGYLDLCRDIKKKVGSVTEESFVYQPLEDLIRRIDSELTLRPEKR
ncbi:MAG: hypothetical protein IK101_04320 [Oscillospiraceae bacterium]|nr:hypothetical protein [Oscillospiraceae bacterium]